MARGGVGAGVRPCAGPHLRRLSGCRAHRARGGDRGCRVFSRERQLGETEAAKHPGAARFSFTAAGASPGAPFVRDPRRLNLNSSPPRGMQRWALRLRSLPWFGVGRRGGRLGEDCEREKRGVRAGGGKQRPGPRARERQSAQRVGGGAGAPEAAPGAAEPMGGRGAGAGGGGAAIRRWRRRPLGDHWQAAVARARTLFAPEAPHGDRSPVPRPRPGPGETHGRAVAGRGLQPVRKTAVPRCGLRRPLRWVPDAECLRLSLSPGARRPAAGLQGRPPGGGGAESP